MSVDRLEEQKLWEGLHPKTKHGISSIMRDVTFKDGRAIANSTGKDVTHLVDVTIKTSGKQVRGLKDRDELSRHQADNGGYIFAFFKRVTTIEERFPLLSRQDIARLMYIATFISWESNRLQSDNGRKHFTKKDIEELVGMSTKRFNEFFKKLECEDIIKEADTGEIFINPTVFYRGELRNHEYDITDLEHTRLFKSTVRELYAKFKGRRLGQLAVIYSVIPFLNFSTNIICYNPEETSEDLIRPMDLKRLSTLLGYKDAPSLKRTLNTIKVDGNPVFGFFENPHDHRQLRIDVNPRVVFAGNGEALRAVKARFN